ncbi:hypothetical protein PM082_024581 [Marasmius tenuissimus]|nr:hypothetical protein PM082_024581 [Marasmius tenuissimus]
MRIRRPLVRLLWLSLAEIVVCFSISGIPDQVPLSQPVVFAWTRTPGDPTRFVLAKTVSGTNPAGPIYPTVSVASGETVGILTASFLDDIKTVFIVGYDLDKPIKFPGDIINNGPRPATFFNDPHQITISGGGSPPTLTTTSSSSLGDSSQTRSPTAGPVSQQDPSTTTITTSSSITSTRTNARTFSALPTSTSMPGGAASGQPSVSASQSYSGMPSITGIDSPASEGGSQEMASESADSSSQDSPQSTPPPEGQSAGPKRRPSIGAIVGAILGTLAFIALLLFLICCRRRIRQKNWRPVRPGTFYGEKMIKRREEDQLEQIGNADRRASNSELLSTDTYASRIAGQVNDSASTASGLSSSRRNSEATLEHPDYTIYTISEVGSSEVDATSTIEPASTEIAHEYITPRTDRQMEIERKIFELQGQIIRLSDRSKSSEIVPSTPISIDLEMLKLREKVVRLRELQDEEWAREVTDEVPFEMLD